MFQADHHCAPVLGVEVDQDKVQREMLCLRTRVTRARAFCARQES